MGFFLTDLYLFCDAHSLQGVTVNILLATKSTDMTFCEMCMGTVWKLLSQSNAILSNMVQNVCLRVETESAWLF